MDAGYAQEPGSLQNANMIANQKLIAEMETGRGLIVRAHPVVGSQLIAIFHQYELFHAGGVFDSFNHMSALMMNVETALQVRPVGMQYCVISSNGVRKIQGLQGEALFLYVRLWEPHIENLKQTLIFRDNKSSFVFSSPTGQEIQAQIRLIAETLPDVGLSTDITQTMEMILAAFDRGIALFMPTVTAAGTDITTNTMFIDLQPLSEDQQRECPFDIRAWNVADGPPEQRLQALQALIQNNKVSMVVSANN
jgi:hypothetical protein